MVCTQTRWGFISTMEAERTAASVVVVDMIGIKYFLVEIGIDCIMPMSLKVDNQAALKQLAQESSSKAKHVDVRIKFVGSYANSGNLKTEYCEGSRMLADKMTKALYAPRLEELKVLIGLHYNG